MTWADWLVVVIGLYAAWATAVACTWRRRAAAATRQRDDALSAAEVAQGGWRRSLEREGRLRSLRIGRMAAWTQPEGES